MRMIRVDPMGMSGAASAASDLAERNLTEHQSRYDVAALLSVRCKILKVEIEKMRVSNARARRVDH
jgi:hypothetical protein